MIDKLCKGVLPFSVFLPFSVLGILAMGSCLLVSGCNGAGDSTSGAESGGVTLTWIATRQYDDGVEIRYGHVGNKVSAGDQFQPAVIVTKNGKVLPLVGVDVRERNDDPNLVIAGGIPLNFEEAENGNPAYYAVLPRMGMVVPKDAVDIFQIEFEIRLNQRRGESFIEKVDIKLD